MARRVWLSLLVPAALAGVALAWMWGCGPGVQAIYEGNVRFEHCYRLDLDAHVAPTHREACWREWTQLYTYGQNRDRVDYAERRMRALASGDYSRPLLNLQKDEGRPEIAPPETPIPTSLNASPPAVLKAKSTPEGGAPADAAPPTKRPAQKPPDAACVDSCRTHWNGCAGACEPAAKLARDAGRAAQHKAGAARETAKKMCRRCQENYRHCMRRCFK